MKRSVLCIWLALLALCSPAKGNQMETDFATPPAQDRPAIFGFLLNAEAVPDAVIIRDMQEMKDKGITSCLLYTPGAGAASMVRRETTLIYGETGNQVVKTNEYKGPGAIPVKLKDENRAWSPEWIKTVRCAAGEAGRLGIELGLTVGGIGCEMAAGMTAEFSEQRLVYSKIETNANVTVDKILPLPEGVRSKNGQPLFYRDIAVLAVPAAQDAIAPEQVLDLTDKMDVNGRLSWSPPSPRGSGTTGSTPEKWLILRFGHTGGGGCIDHLSAEALDKKWDLTMKPLLAAMTPAERKGVTFIECDSYEGGPQTWTPKFPKEFHRLRGYDIKKWLPVLAGLVVGNKDRSSRFQQDYKLTISDLHAENHYAKHTALARANGLRFCAEAAGPHQRQTDMLKGLSRCDVPMGEFWIPGTHRGVGDERRFLLRDAASAAHIYGMTNVLCEAFTGGNDPWRDTPFAMKPCGDQAYCDGLTRPCIHGYSISPWLNDAPGVSYWAGCFLNRHTTWWNQSAPFFTYLGRCSYMLRQGIFAADVAYYDGDGIGRNLSRKAAGPALGGQYDFDRVNTEVLLTRMSAKNGRIVLPDGLSYRLLVLAETIPPISMAALRKLSELTESGATILGTRPTGPDGLADDPAEFKTLADKLWGEGEQDKTGVRSVGKGRVAWGRPVLEFLKDDGVQPDFSVTGVSSNGIIDWIHRTSDDGEIYFVCSRWQPVEQIDCSFRVTGKLPELWDPVTGMTRDAGAFRMENGRTVVPLKMDPFGSVFVLFRKTTTETARTGKNWMDFQPLQEIAGPWDLAFDPKWVKPSFAETTAGIPGKTAVSPEGAVVFEKLVDWTTRPEPGIKYYSGTATYRKVFNYQSPDISQRTFLDLGKVCEVAHVRLNGKDLGTLWTRPFRAEITGALKQGENQLEIDIVNLWPNRMIGDTFLPADQRLTRTSLDKYTKFSKLLPSGLLGPVTIQTAK